MLKWLLKWFRRVPSPENTPNEGDTGAEARSSILEAFRNECRRQIEAGVALSLEQWDALLSNGPEVGALLQNVYLEERQRFRERNIALLSIALADTFGGGVMAASMCEDLMDEKAQDHIMIARMKVLQRMRGDPVGAGVSGD